MTRPTHYHWPAAVLLRAATASSPAPPPHDLDDPRHVADWLRTTWSEPRTAAVLTQTSPALAERVGALLAQPAARERDLRRAACSTLSYLLRWQGRSTPVDRLAGVATVQTAERTKVLLGTADRTVVRADAGWLGHIIKRLRAFEELARQLKLRANNTAVARGTRLTTIGAAPLTGDELAPLDTSIRNTRIVQTAIGRAKQPVTATAICQALAGNSNIPESVVGAKKISGLLASLIDLGVLLDSLIPPADALDAFGHVIAALPEADNVTAPALGRLRAELARIHHDLTTDPRAAARRMTALAGPEASSTPLVVDTALDAEVQITESVLAAARDAAEMMLRLSPYPNGYPAWAEYHERFLRRYGDGAVVPLLELVADSGVGYPAGYSASALDPVARTLTARDEVLLALIQKAAVASDEEIVLTEQLIRALAITTPHPPQLPSRIEIGVEVHAASCDAIDRGNFELAITSAPRPASSMIGRHLHLLSSPDRQALAATYEAAASGALPVQLLCPPRRRRNENITRTGPILPHTIDIAGTDDRNAIALHDLGVTANTQQMRLIQLSSGQMIEPRVAHALEAGVHTHPLARFIAEINTAHAAVYKRFHLGGATRLPHVPRIRYKKTILSPARWLLNANDLPTAPEGQDSAFQHWCARWRVPQHVAIVEGDRLLPMDLFHLAHRQLLTDRLNRTGHLELRETAAPEDLGWIGRAHELVIPLMLNPERATPAPAPAPPSLIRTVNDTVIAARLHGHPARFEEILLEHLAPLADTAQARWWFERRRTPAGQQYLEVFLQPHHPFHDIAAELRALADRLADAHLVSGLELIGYEPPQIGAGLDNFHAVLCADSAAAISQIRTATVGQTAAEALAAVSVLHIATAITGTTAAGDALILSCVPQGSGPLSRQLREEAFDVSDRPPTAVIEPWDVRASCIRDLPALASSSALFKRLTRQHISRALGAAPEYEPTAFRLARAAALRRISLDGRR
jgi:lantibiotic biosynthesis protein